MIRSNLSALEERYRGEWLGLLKDHRVVIVASLPSTNEAQADSQRGRGIFQTSLDTLRKLNAMGYGQDGTGLELDLVSNPTGAFLPTPQRQMEQRFREILKKKWGIVFNHSILLPTRLWEDSASGFCNRKILRAICRGLPPASILALSKG